MSDGSICQACRARRVAEVIGDDDPQEPYRVCRECAERLRLQALRPLEWFNLAAIHGPYKYYLHSDFYDQAGSSDHPEVGAYTDGMLAPSLRESSGSLERLVDYCIARWWIDAPECEALRAYPSDAIFNELQRRTRTGNRHVLNVAFELCARVLGDAAGSWVRAQYARACRDGMLFRWSQAAAGCLPVPEGLHMAMDALRAFEGKELRHRKDALLWFRSPAVLDWIEAHAPGANVTGDWGQLAALSDLSWTRVQDWLVRGRPLSLIALDALGICIPHAGQAPIVRDLEPKLRGCPDHGTITRVLEACMASDGAPRVAGSCRYIIERLGDMRTE